MDINILLWLQGLREAAGPGVENFFATASAAAVNALFLVIPFAIFWCVDKAKGSVAITSFALGNTVNQLVKNTVCVPASVNFGAVASVTASDAAP